MGRNVTALGLEKSESKKELKKHAATIHCSNSLSLLQRKISNALLYHAYNELMLKEEHEITVKQLCRLIGYQGNNHAAIRDALKELISTVIEWNVVDENTGAENWTASSIIASVSLEGPLCYYAYSPRMKQLLHMPSMFGKIDLVIQSQFRSSYGLALYENCIRYRGLLHTKWFEMGMFKKLMGVPTGTYDIFRDFKRRVLDKAIDEVNSYSDLIISAEFIKERRAVVKIRFTLKERPKKTRLGSIQKKKLLPRPLKLSSLLHTQLSDEFHLTEQQIKSLCHQYDPDYIQAKIKLIYDSKPYKKGEVENLAGYLLTALKHDYQPPKKQRGVIKAIANREAEEEMAMLKKQVDLIKSAYFDYREATIESAIQALPNDERDTLIRQFHSFAGPSIQTILSLQRTKYSLDTILESPQIRAQFRQFIRRELDSLSLLSIEEFVATLDEGIRESWLRLKSFDPDHALLCFTE